MRPNYLQALKHAEFVYTHKDSMDRQARVDAAIALAQWGCFSNSHISKLTGLLTRELAAFTGKTDGTGGRFSPHAIGPILEVIHGRARGFVDPRDVRRAVAAGASTGMIAKLTGESETNLRRWAKNSA